MSGTKTIQEISAYVKFLVQGELGGLSRTEFIKRLEPLYASSPFQIIFMDLIPSDPLPFNCAGILIFMSIDYRDAGRYVVVNS